MFARLSAVAALALFAAGSVQAADLIVDDAAVAAATVGVDWSGAYVGAHIGAAAGTVDWVFADTDIGDSYDIDGLLIGGQLGYNWQSGNMVYGVEGSLSLATVEGDFGRINWVASLLGRVGYAMDTVLFYGVAGISVSDNTGDIFGVIQNDQTQFGAVVGVGLEAMLADNVSAKVEYNYTANTTATYDYFPGLFEVDASYDTHAIKAGVNFHF